MLKQKPDFKFHKLNTANMHTSTHSETVIFFFFYNTHTTTHATSILTYSARVITFFFLLVS